MTLIEVTRDCLGNMVELKVTGHTVSWPPGSVITQELHEGIGCCAGVSTICVGLKLAFHEAVQYEESNPGFFSMDCSASRDLTQAGALGFALETLVYMAEMYPQFVRWVDNE